MSVSILIKRFMFCAVTTRAISLILIFCNFIPKGLFFIVYYIIFLFLIWFSLYVLSTVLASLLVLPV
jgi:hypothetical protein